MPRKRAENRAEPGSTSPEGAGNGGRRMSDPAVVAEQVEHVVQDGIAWLSVANPPVNALSRSTRVALIDALDRAEADPGVRIVVLQGRGHTFPAGADIAEFDAPLEAPWIPELCARVEGFPKPVVASLHGTVLGGGLELALAAHYRIALASTRVGLPEVRLGLIPGAGGTQRVPRMLGAGPALDLMLSGAMMPVDVAPGRALVDALADGDLRAATETYCRTLLDEGKGPRRSSDIRKGFADAATYQKAVAERRAMVAQRPEIAPREIVAAVEAAWLLPFEAGLAFEEDAFATCLKSDQSRALRGAFFAERRAHRFGFPKGTAIPALDRIAVLGGGPLAAQLVITALNAGLGVNWGTRDPDAIRAGVMHVRDVFREGVAKGLPEAQAEERMALLKVGDSARMTEGADMILHAARGQGDVPAPEGVVRAVVFSGRVQELGLRFAPPVYGTRLVEVIAGPQSTAAQHATALSLARALGKIAIKVRSEGDSLAGHLMAACQRAADALVDAGQTPYRIDQAFRDWGWSRPPFQARDMAGFNETAGQSRAEGARNWSVVLADAGRSGRAAGRGFYLWPGDGQAPREEPAVLAVLDGLRRPAPPMPLDAIRLLVLGAMANEGARMLASGMASRPSDIDIAAVLALDMPRWRGGPMHLASVPGLLAVQRALQRFDHPDRAFWTPEPVFADLIKNGRTFDSLNV